MALPHLPAEVPWPPDPLTTERLVLRAPQGPDRDGFIHLLTSPDARRFLGGPLTPSVAQDVCAASGGLTPGSFAITLAESGAFVGTVGLDRRDAEGPGHLARGGLELEVSYVVSPAHWRQGYAAEAVAAALAWAAGALAHRQIVACAQTANAASAALLRRLRFHELADRLTEFGAEQSLWVRPLEPSLRHGNGP